MTRRDTTFRKRKRKRNEEAGAVGNRPEQADARQKKEVYRVDKQTLCFRQDKARPVKGFVITNHEYIAAMIKKYLEKQGMKRNYPISLDKLEAIS